MKRRKETTLYYTTFFSSRQRIRKSLCAAICSVVSTSSCVTTLLTSSKKHYIRFICCDIPPSIHSFYKNKSLGKCLSHLSTKSEIAWNLGVFLLTASLTSSVTSCCLSMNFLGILYNLCWQLLRMNGLVNKVVTAFFSVCVKKTAAPIGTAAIDLLV